MPYNKKPNYSHQDIKAFFEKDLLIVKQTCLNASASIHQGDKFTNGTTSSQMIAEAEELLKWFYPKGTQYNCGNKYCMECNPNLKKELEKEHHIFQKSEELPDELPFENDSQEPKSN